MSPKCWKEKETVADDMLALWKERIESVLIDTPCYGYRKVTAHLKRSYQVNHKKIMRLMRETGLTQKRRVYKPRTTNSRHMLPVFPNLVKTLIPSFPFHIWVTDITYVHLPQGFCYVAIVLDIFTKEVVGWSIALHMEESLVREALEMALLKGVPQYHHSDRGGQYCALQYLTRLKEKHIQVSMADTGVSVDNPYAESFNKTLKVEEVYLHEYQTLEEARSSIKDFIERVYYTKRLHQSLEYLTPSEFTQRWQLQEMQKKVL